jgi:putative ABC transport system permease protein
MKFVRLILKNTFRNRRRTILTILSISMSLFLISTLRTLLESLESPPLTADSATRVLTRHQTSLANLIPIAYRDRIRQMPGVKEISAYQWFGGVYKDPSNFFAQFAVDADRFFDIYTDIHVESAEQKEAFIKERAAALAGVSLAKRQGWKIGDRITLQGTAFPVNPELIIRGFVKDGGSDGLLFFRFDYLSELFRNPLNGTSTYVIKVRSAEEIPAVIDIIDGTFANSTAPTKTETEKAFVLGFMSMLGNVRTLVVSISTVVIFTIILVAANTMAMSIRERIGEIAILKTLGFSPAQMLGVLISESVIIALVGGLLGSLAARYIFGAVDMDALTMGFIPIVNVTWTTVTLAAGISIVVAFASTFIPAWSASRLPIAEAVRRRGE